MSRPTKLENASIDYFPIRGRAEPIRLALEDHGISYADNSVNRETWPQDKMVYENFPFNQGPVFGVNGERVAQQDAILRYITKVMNAAPLNFKDETISDMLAVAVEDLNRVYTTANYSPDYVEKFTGFLTTQVPKIFGQFEYFLSRLAHANPPAFIEGPHPCFTEYTLFHLVEAITTLQPSALDKTPRLKAWFAAFGQRKGIRAYIESGRRQKTFNGNANGENKIMD